MITVMQLQKTLIPSELIYQYLMFGLLLSDNNSRLQYCIKPIVKGFSLNLV